MFVCVCLFKYNMKRMEQIKMKLANWEEPLWRTDTRRGGCVWGYHVKIMRKTTHITAHTFQVQFQSLSA